MFAIEKYELIHFFFPIKEKPRRVFRITAHPRNHFPKIKTLFFSWHPNKFVPWKQLRWSVMHRRKKKKIIKSVLFGWSEWQ